MTVTEHKARSIAYHLVDVLAEIELFRGNIDIILDDASTCLPHAKISDLQLAEIKVIVSCLKQYFEDESCHS